MCQISADAKNKNPTLENLSGALDWTVCQVSIYSGKAKLVFYNLSMEYGVRTSALLEAAQAKAQGCLKINLDLANHNKTSNTAQYKTLGKFSRDPLFK